MKEKSKKVVLAYSGGLDTSFCIAYLKDHDFEIHAVFVDTYGEHDSYNEELLKKRALELGAKSFKKIKALESFYQRVIRFLIFGNVLKNNTYPLSVSAERITQAFFLQLQAKKIGAKYIAHGCTGAGNDQIRFDTAFQILAPELNIIAPIRSNNFSRKEEIKYLNSKGIGINWEKAKYSVNQGLWGTTIGGDQTLTSHQPLPEEAFSVMELDKKPQELELSLVKGELLAINGKEKKPHDLIKDLNILCREYGIGRNLHVGDTILGIKGRVGFEAGGPLLLIKAHHLLEKHTLSKWQLFQKDQLSLFYGMMIHEGNFWDPVNRDIEAFLIQSQRKVTGKVFCKLFPKGFELQGIKSKHDLMKHHMGAYGEKNSGWSAQDSEGFIKITSLSNKIYQTVNHSL
ncbi:MAG: argininosuccinate synthase [Flavobacteriaceae bacterium]|nr:argininosuccinate synthase [Flavobacteriaceae bacterium]MCY4253788.1 argininosuccinate synthase [Flavobacteriaceae bacterium]